MLKNAGLDFKIIPADIDERRAKDKNKKPADIAAELAQQKALAAAKKNPQALVIGADQVLEFDGKMLNKACDEKDAREKLWALNGKTHRLISAVAVAKGEEILWAHTEEACLTMRNFDDAFLDEYCGRAGAALTRSVGAYEIESSGAWLFEEVEGDVFTIMGMPLLPLLKFLKTQGFGP